METFNVKTKTSGKCRVYPDSPSGLQPSVTSICGALMKYGLIQWAADCAVDYIKNEAHLCWVQPDADGERTGDFGPNDALFDEARHAHDQIKDKAADFGTHAHELCQKYMETGNWPVHFIDEKAEKLFESFVEWAEKNKIEPVHTEIKLHGDGYSGRCDLIAYRTCPKTGERRLGLYDIKTGKGSYYPEWGLQLCAYAKAYAKPLDEIGIIKLNKDTLKCNFSEQSKPKFTADMDRYARAWKSLVKFYWEYNNLAEQFKEISLTDTDSVVQ